MDGTAAQTDSGGNTASAPAAPTSFAEAFAADASPASNPPAQSNDAAAAAQPTTETGTTPAADERSPFIPRQRFDEVNTKLAEHKEWRDKHGWAETVDRAQVDQAVRIAQMYQQDRAGYLRSVLAESLADPQLAPLIRSELGRALAGQRQAGVEDSEPQADVPVDFGDGKIVRFYSAEQQAKREAWLQKQWMGQVEQKMAPALSAAEKLKQAEAKEQATTWSSGFVGELAKYPGFSEHKAAIYQDVSRQLAQSGASDDPAFLEAATLKAYTRIVLPTLAQKTAQQAESRLLDNLQQKAAASTSPNPGSAAPTTQKPITSFHDKALTWK